MKKKNLIAKAMKIVKSAVQAKKPSTKTVSKKPAVKPVASKPVAQVQAKKSTKADAKGSKKPENKSDSKLNTKAQTVAGKGLAGPVTKGTPKEDTKNVKSLPTQAVTPKTGNTSGVLSVKPKKASSAVIEVGEKMCRESGCENVATTKGYCRLDYIKNWKKIKRKEMILKEGKLNQYIEELVSKYPDRYIEVIRQDLQSEVNFTKVITDLELDESIDDLEYDGDSIDSLIGSIKKETDDFGGTDGDF